MRKIKWIFETGFLEAHTGEIEVEDSATDDEIEQLVLEDIFNIVGFSWQEVEG